MPAQVAPWMIHARVYRWSWHVPTCLFTGLSRLGKTLLVDSDLTKAIQIGEVDSTTQDIGSTTSANTTIEISHGVAS